MKTIIEGCQNCPAKHVLLILDCCYSGFAANRAIQSLQKSYAATEDYIRDISSRAAVQVFAAGQEDQPVSDSGIRPGYSAFTGALLDILEPEVDPDNNGILTASEIGYSLERQVAVQEQRGSFQRPVYSHLSGSQGGDFIFKIFKLKKPTIPPTIEHKSIETTSGVPIEILLTASNLDPDNIAQFSLVNTPEHGIVKSGITNNSFVYTPNAGFVGEDTFTYKATNSQGVDSNIATINITIKPVPPLKPSSPYSDERYVVVPGIPRPPETNKQYQHQHQQRSLFGNPKVLIPIIAVVAAAVIVLVVFGVGIMHQQQPQPTQQPSTSTPTGNPNPKPRISNNPPTAVAGTSQTVNAGDKVTLDGSSSKDPDGSIAKYSWTQISGSPVTLINVDTSRPSFTAPSVTSDIILKFSLAVKDDKGAASSNTAIVTVTVKASGTTALRSKGDALTNLGNKTLALQYYDKALSINPNDTTTLNNKGHYLYNLGNYTQAILYYDKALSIDPNDTTTLSNKGDALDSLGNHTQAIQYYDKALSIDPEHTDALKGKGDSLDSLRNYTQAIQYYDKALSINPNDTIALNNKGHTLYHLGNYTQAIPYYDKALSIDPNDTTTLSNKGDALNSLGNYTQAIQYYDKALGIDPNKKYALDGKGDALDSLGNYTQAIPYYDKALSIDPKDAQALRGKGDALSKQ
ncbi:MAG TPA: tetratricopeptide repeat protein [Nitrososphaeraceae archaeon]|jgi:tetratricopeptide (TPR) repeat protein